MTIRDKFLKDGVSVEEFVEFFKSKQPNNKYDITFHDIALWLETKVTPTLTEEERVILRVIDEKFNKRIKRNHYGDILFGSDSEWYYCDIFNHLFQFIKERRRI